MNIAIQNPMFSGMSGLHGWVGEFIRIYRPIIYISDIRYLPRYLYFLYRYRLNPLQYKITFFENFLNISVDVLVCFNGHPYRKENKPVKSFIGLKIYHLMDYTFFPEESNKALEQGGVQYVFGYAKHNLYCKFFQKLYPNYVDKLIPVPFGFADRFKNNILFSKRKNKIVALGAINSFLGVTNDILALKTVNKFFLCSGEKFMHKFRRILLKYENDLEYIMESKLPRYPKTVNFDYDLSEVFNKYKMFVSCESLQFFPPAKTFEGVAAGSVLVCSDHPCYSDLGFKDGVNCIKYKEYDIKDFEKKVHSFLLKEKKLHLIQRNAVKFVRQNYNHSAIAKKLYVKISETYAKHHLD